MHEDVSSPPIPSYYLSTKEISCPSVPKLLEASQIKALRFAAEVTVSFMELACTNMDTISIGTKLLKTSPACPGPRGHEGLCQNEVSQCHETQEENSHRYGGADSKPTDVSGSLSLSRPQNRPRKSKTVIQDLQSPGT
ncbi:unnamed protein product [Caretta caretta]